jgi:flagellar assembly protein FliH
MLSKVLKGADARQVQAMAFATAAPASAPAHHQPSRSDTPDTGERSVLLEKVRLLEAGLTAAKREAFSEGYRQGEEHAKAAVSPVLGRMNASISEMVNMRPELRRLAEEDAVKLALQIARRVLHRELSIDANALNALARVVFDRLTRTESWQLTVHPQFADAIRGALPAGSAQKVRIETDASCEPGTLVVRSEGGVIDASVDNQLEEISRGLTDRLTRK